MGEHPTIIGLGKPPCNAELDFAYSTGTAETNDKGDSRCTARGSEDGVKFILEPFSYPTNYSACKVVINGVNCATHYRYVINATVSIHTSFSIDWDPICVPR